MGGVSGKGDVQCSGAGFGVAVGEVSGIDMYFKEALPCPFAESPFLCSTLKCWGL